MVPDTGNEEWVPPVVVVRVAHLPHELVSSLKAEPVPPVPYTLFPKALSTEFPVRTSVSHSILAGRLFMERNQPFGLTPRPQSWKSLGK